MQNMFLEPRFDPEQCEFEYNLRRRHADFPTILKDWQARSAQTRADLEVALDQPYGASPAERLDVFPAGGSSAPVVLFIHGGYWQGGDKHDVSFIARQLVSAGIAVAVNNYGLAPGNSLAEMVAQTRRAVAWLRDNADRFGIDGTRIHLMGHSAGGHLAAMMLTEHGPEHAVRSAIAISGLFDLAPLLHTSLNHVVRLRPEQVGHMSPARLKKRVDTPLYAIVGELETEAFRTQVDWLGSRWDGVHSLPLVSGKHHYTVLDIFMNAPNPWLTRVLDVVLDRVTTPIG